MAKAGGLGDGQRAFGAIDLFQSSWSFVSYSGHRRGLELGLGVYHGVFWRNDMRPFST